ncbi:MAG: DMT family transporter [Actinomycetia bacterium]|nr:DMT family transporter [Actinomycetes bacterium]
MSRARLSAWSLVAAAACWGTATAISKRAVEEIAPLTLLPIELAVSVAVLLAASTIAGDRTLPTSNRAALGWLGVLNPGLSYALSLAGLARITASSSALLWATEPILILALAWLVLRQRPSTPTLGCAAIALVGVVLVVAQPGIRLSTSGVVLTVAGVAACAVYTVLSSQYLGEHSTLGVVLLQQSSALGFAVFLGIGGLLTGHAGSLADVSLTGWASALAAGALYYGVAFWFYVNGLRSCSPTVAGLFINLVPVFGVSSAALLLGERLATRQWIGSMLILAAVTAVAVMQSKRPSADQVGEEGRTKSV